MCSAMNNCNGFECGDNGQCKCPLNRKGADCSFAAYNVSATSTFTVSTKGDDWFYLTHTLMNDTDKWMITL